MYIFHMNNCQCTFALASMYACKYALIPLFWKIVGKTNLGMTEKKQAELWDIDSMELKGPKRNYLDL